MTDAINSSAPANSIAPAPTMDDIATYQPPSSGTASAPSPTPMPSAAPWAPTPVPAAVTAPVTPVMPVTINQPSVGSMNMAPSPMQVSPSSSVPSAVSAPAQSENESLESQNIFALLGVDDGTEADKEAFLDELQEVIWQDFVANDLQLLLTREELDQVRAMQAKTSDAVQQQTEIVAFLEKLIPDLEDIMLEKALELKRQMVRERVSGLREYLAGKPDQLAKLDAAEQLTKQNRWTQAAQALNALR